MTIVKSADLRGWFRERLVHALERQRLGVSASTQVYLVELLHSFATSPRHETLDRPLALQLADAVEAEGPEKIRLLRAMGDAALYIAGFFADHLDRRGVTLSYAIAMGGRAYSSAESLCAYSPAEASRRHVYGELADGFHEFVRALDDVRESTDLRTPQDIVRMYERWKRTRSPRLAERLREEGVVPTAGSKLLH